MKPEPTHYDNLMVSRNASLEVIRAAYRVLTQKYHPDRHPDDAEATRLMQVINESYAVIGDPEKRQEYDRGLAEQERSFALALEARRAVPVLQEALEDTPLDGQVVPVLREAPAEAPSHHPRYLGRIASLTFGAAVFMAAGAGAYRYVLPQFAQGVRASLTASAPSESSASSTERRQWQSGAIARSSAVSVSDSSASAVSSESSASSASDIASSESSFASVESNSATSAVTQDLVDRPRKTLAQHPGPPAKAAATRRAHAPKRVVPPVHLVAAETALVTPVSPAPVDDLAEVRTRDPAAAERISSYCRGVAKTAVDAEKGGTACRRNETAAWRHFAVTSNFSEIYEEVGTRCVASIYPDSYEAKEACVKYELGNRKRSD